MSRAIVLVRRYKRPMVPDDVDTIMAAEMEWGTREAMGRGRGEGRGGEGLRGGGGILF